MHTTDYICPTCASGLVSSDTNLYCQSCDWRYPIVYGIPIIIKNATYKPGNEIAASVVEKFLRLLGLATNQDSLRVARKILGGKLEHPSDFIEAESRQFPSRIKATLPDEWSEDLDMILSDAPMEGSAPPINVFDQIQFCWTICYFPEKIRTGELLRVNCRLKNTGTATISSLRGWRRKPIVASGHWLSIQGEQETHRTDLLVDLAPQAELTFPLLIQAPKSPGDYRFRPSLLAEGSRWFIGTQEYMISVVDEAIIHPDGFEISAAYSSYGEDHVAAVNLLKDWIKELGATPKAIELGGNFNPCLISVVPSFLNVDVDLMGLQFSAMKNDGVIHVCADGLELPLADRSLDLIAIFASLHHFPDPTELLSRLKGKLKPSGRIALMCEPVGHVTRASIDKGYLSELEKGVNEQSFSLDEYKMMFRSSNLEVKYGVVHGGSLKVWLAPSLVQERNL